MLRKEGYMGARSFNLNNYLILRLITEKKYLKSIVKIKLRHKSFFRIFP